jgi:hypothetical protein
MKNVHGQGLAGMLANAFGMLGVFAFCVFIVLAVCCAPKPSEPKQYVWGADPEKDQYRSQMEKAQERVKGLEKEVELLHKFTPAKPAEVSDDSKPTAECRCKVCRCTFEGNVCACENLNTQPRSKPDLKPAKGLCPACKCENGCGCNFPGASSEKPCAKDCQCRKQKE